MKIYTQLLKISLFKIHKVLIRLLVLLFFILASGNSFAQDKVLTIYFCGSGCAETWWLPNHQGWEVTPELVANLYYNDSSTPINKIIDPKTNIVTDIFTTTGKKHYKYIANGIGYGPSFVNVLEKANADLGNRGWEEVLNEGQKVFSKISSQGGRITLNLIGFSRGGILCMKIARRVADNNQIKKINILAFDPVPGDPDPIYRHGYDLVLPAKVNQYIGIYARDERSYMFEPVIPDQSELPTKSKVWLVEVPGGHETMVGNCQNDGHSTKPTGSTRDSSFVKDMKSVSNITTAIAEQLLTSKEWDGYENKILNLSKFSNKSDFESQASIMNGFTGWSTLKNTSFLADLLFSNYVSVPSQKLWLRSFTLKIGNRNWRLCFKAPYRYAAGLLGNHEQVFGLSEELEKLTKEDWDTLQSLRGDYDPPVPDIATLPDLNGECSVNVNTIPTATDAIAGTITGTTEDPLEYTEQGTYTIIWTYDDGNGNVATQEQIVIVEDVTPPVIEELLAYSFTIFPSNYKSEEVPLWPVNFKSNEIYETPRRPSRENFDLLKHQRKYETITINQLVESVSDNCSDLSPDDVVITKVTCDEPEDTRRSLRLRNQGEKDIIISDDCKSVDLKREFDFRGNGRVYTVHLSLKDEVGNEAIETCQFGMLVSAPAKMAIADTPAYETYSGCYETGDAPLDMIAGIYAKSGLTAEKSLEKEEILPEAGFVKNYPNPFNSNTTFTFGVTEKSDVTLSIYNMQGQLVRVLYSGTIDPGSINVDWDGTDASGNKMASGVYIYRLLANNSVVASGKAVLRK